MNLNKQRENLTYYEKSLSNKYYLIPLILYSQLKIFMFFKRRNKKGVRLNGVYLISFTRTSSKYNSASKWTFQ